MIVSAAHDAPLGWELRHVRGVRGLVGFDPGRAALPRPLGEHVVGGDDVVGHAEQVEEQRGDDAGAVLARGAVEDRGERVVVAQQLEHECERAAELLDDAEVALARRQWLGHERVHFCRVPRLQLHVVEHRDVVPGDVPTGRRQPAVVVDLGGRAQVDHRAEAEGVELLDVGGGEAVQRVGAVETVPADAAAVPVLVAAQVPEVEARLERDVARLVAPGGARGIAPGLFLASSSGAPAYESAACATSPGRGIACVDRAPLARTSLN